jgi:hypothetical protein
LFKKILQSHLLLLQILVLWAHRFLEKEGWIKNFLSGPKQEEDFLQSLSLSDTYLEEEFVRRDERFEILSWWRINANKYPVLSAMARDLLTIPLSIVPSESAFSTGGRILAGNRSSMTPETLECLVCCKEWLYEYPNIHGT